MFCMQPVLLAALLGCTVALPQVRYPQQYQYQYPVQVVSRYLQSDPAGAFRSDFTTGDGARVEETGYLKPTNDGQDQVLAKTGSYAYTSPEGVPVVIQWVADEYGFKPTGSVIPVAPQEQPPSF